MILMFHSLVPHEDKFFEEIWKVFSAVLGSFSNLLYFEIVGNVKCFKANGLFFTFPLGNSIKSSIKNNIERLGLSSTEKV